MDIKENKLNPIVTILLALMLIFFVIPIIHFAEAIKQENSITKSVTPVNTNEFGIVPDLLVAFENQFADGDNYHQIFRRMGLPKNLSSRILYEGKEFLTGFTDGDVYHTYINAFDPDELIYLVLEKDPVNYVIVELRDSVKVYEGQKELTVKRKVIEGVIKTSFYHSLRGNDLNPDVISKLSEIYQWQIDFHRLKRGDNFKFVLEEKYAGDSLIGIPQITGAYFNHNKEDFYAFRYDNPEAQGYYDLDGKNVKKSFLKAPLEFTAVSSPYSEDRLHPVLKVNRPHYGTDYAAPEGTPIFSVADGVVMSTGYTGGNGNYVRIKHDEIYETQYLHMSRIASNTMPGKNIRQGDVIGYVGSTGLATGPHLCFRFWKNGEQVDPASEKMPSDYVLNNDLMTEFIAKRDVILSLLNVDQVIEINIASN